MLILWVQKVVKGQKTVHMTKNCLSHSISQEWYITWLWLFGAHVKNDDISSKFFHFWKSWFLEVLGSKRAKNDRKLPISVCFALHLRNCRSYHQDFDNDIYRCISLYFFKKCNIVNIKIISTVFLIICFSSSSINTKKKIWGVPHLHMCVVFRESFFYRM